MNIDIKQIQAYAAMAQTAAQAGMTLIGGIKTLGAIFGQDLTIEEQDAIEAEIVADATRRKAESARMAGDAQ